MFKNKVLLVLAGFAIVAPTITYIFTFHKLAISDVPSDWESFSVYFSGFTGTITTIIAGFYIYKTFNLQNEQIRIQNEQSIDEIFFVTFHKFIDSKIEIAKKLVDYEENILHAGIATENRQREKPYTDEEIKTLYIKYLKQFFITNYSITTKTPRLNIELKQYFQRVNTLCYLFLNAEMSAKHHKELRFIFLNEFHDSEIKMICYYNFLFHDIVNSKDQNFTATNIVKESKVFDGDLFFSDDFSRNLDPRNGVFDEAIFKYKEDVKRKRLQNIESN